jgi:hypothetical protein
VRKIDSNYSGEEIKCVKEMYRMMKLKRQTTRNE